MVCGTSPRHITEGNRVLPRVCGCVGCVWGVWVGGRCELWGVLSLCHLTANDPLQLGLFKEFNTLSVMYEDLSENFVEQKPPYSVVKDSIADGSLKAGAFTVTSSCPGLLLSCVVVFGCTSLLFTPCNMLSAPCDMLSAHCNMLSAPCVMLCTHCNMLFAPCDMLSAPCDMLPSPCNMMYSCHAPLELTFDTGRFVPESYSSSPGEPSTPGSLHREAQESEPVAGVPIADLLVRAVGEHVTKWHCTSKERRSCT